MESFTVSLDYVTMFHSQLIFGGNLTQETLDILGQVKPRNFLLYPHISAKRK